MFPDWWRSRGRHEACHLLQSPQRFLGSQVSVQASLSVVRAMQSAWSLKELKVARKIVQLVDENDWEVMRMAGETTWPNKDFSDWQNYSMQEMKKIIQKAVIGPVDPAEKFAQLTNMTISEDELDIMAVDYRHIYTSMFEVAPRANVLTSTLREIRTMVKSRTRLNLACTGVYVNGRIPGAFGQPQTIIQYAHVHGLPCCAKVGPRRVIERERNVYGHLFPDRIPPIAPDESVRMSASNCFPTVVPVLAMILIPAGSDEGVDRAILLTPLYTLSASLFVPGQVSKPVLFNFAMCVLSAIRAFNARSYCHCDLKPANIMLASERREFVVIDLGSATPYGQPMGATTAMWAADAPEYPSLEYDLSCLGTMLAYFLGAELGEGDVQPTRAGLLSAVSGIEPTVVQMIRDCYFPPVSTAAVPTRSVDQLWGMWTGYIAAANVPQELLCDLSRLSV